MNDCLFCALVSGGENALLALRTGSVFVVPSLKQRQLNLGYMLVLSTRHVTRMIDLEPPVVQELYTVAGRVSIAVRQAFSAQARLFSKTTKRQTRNCYTSMFTSCREEQETISNSQIR